MVNGHPPSKEENGFRKTIRNLFPPSSRKSPSQLSSPILPASSEDEMGSSESWRRKLFSRSPSEAPTRPSSPLPPTSSRENPTRETPLSKWPVISLVWTPRLGSHRQWAHTTTQIIVHHRRHLDHCHRLLLQPLKVSDFGNVTVCHSSDSLPSIDQNDSSTQQGPNTVPSGQSLGEYILRLPPGRCLYLYCPSRAHQWCCRDAD